MENPEKLLDLLSQDARLTPAQLAAMTGATEAEVVDAVRTFEKNDTILGYKTVIDWDKTSKESVTALIEVKISTTSTATSSLSSSKKLTLRIVCPTS